MYLYWKDVNCYRLIHGEADGLSGLIIDKFADVFIIEPIHRLR